MSKAKWIVAVMLVIMTGVAAYTILVQACLGVATFWSIGTGLYAHLVGALDQQMGRINGIVVYSRLPMTYYL